MRVSKELKKTMRDMKVSKENNDKLKRKYRISNICSMQRMKQKECKSPDTVQKECKSLSTLQKECKSPSTVQKESTERV